MVRKIMNFLETAINQMASVNYGVHREMMGGGG